MVMTLCSLVFGHKGFVGTTASILGEILFEQ